HEFHLYAQGRADLVADVDIEALPVAIRAARAHGRKIRIDADPDRAILDDVVERSRLGRRKIEGQRRQQSEARQDNFFKHEASPWLARRRSAPLLPRGTGSPPLYPPGKAASRSADVRAGFLGESTVYSMSTKIWARGTRAIPCR